MKIVTVEEMRALDCATIQGGVSGHLLMERAGQGAFREIRRFLERLEPQHRQRLTILAGKGNNGGDAYVVARLAAHASLHTTVYATCTVDELTGDAKLHALAAKRCVRIVPCDRLPDDALTPGTVIIDGLLGTGAKGALRPPCDAFVAQVSAANLPVIALDIPSGLDGDTGQVADNAIHADLTITMALPKRGLLSPEGLRHSGVLRCIDIGIPSEAVENTAGVGDALFSADIAPLLRRRPHDGHKGTFGHVLVAGGSRWYGGAPFLAAAAALRSGAGLATVAIPEGCLPPTSGLLAALIVRRLPAGETGVLGPKACVTLVELSSRAQAIVFGPGIGSSPASAAVLKVLADQPLPLVLDADALRLAARHRDMLAREGDTILTPHPGEMRALLSGLGLESLLEASREAQAAGVATACDAFVVLKGRGTVLAAPDGRITINTSGTTGLATAGSGDVLAGLLGGLLAQGFRPWDALRLGVFAHGLAAEEALERDRALVADDLPSHIATVFQHLSPFA